MIDPWPNVAMSGISRRSNGNVELVLKEVCVGIFVTHIQMEPQAGSWIAESPTPICLLHGT